MNILEICESNARISFSLCSAENVFYGGYIILMDKAKAQAEEFLLKNIVYRGVER